MNRPPSCCTVCHNTRGTGTQSLTCALGSASFNTTLHHKMINRKNLLGKRAKRKVVHSKSRKCKRCYLVFEIRGWRYSHGSRYRVLFWCLRFRSLLCVPREMSTPQPAPLQPSAHSHYLHLVSQFRWTFHTVAQVQTVVSSRRQDFAARWSRTLS